MRRGRDRLATRSPPPAAARENVSRVTAYLQTKRSERPVLLRMPKTIIDRAPNLARNLLTLRQMVFQSSQLIHSLIKAVSTATIAFFKSHLSLVNKIHFHLAPLIFKNRLNSP